MPASTRAVAIAAVFGSVLWAGAVQAGVHSFDVSATSNVHQEHAIAVGIGEILCSELTRGGWYTASLSNRSKTLNDTESYALQVELLGFEVVRKGDTAGFLGEMFRLSGAGKVEAMVSFKLTLKDPGGSVILSSLYEGIESRHGKPLPTHNEAFLAGCNFLGDQFRLSMEGRATYKAVGNALQEIYFSLPVRGSVLAMNGDAVVADLGTSTGVKVGDMLAVFKVQGIMNDAGAVMWKHERRVGTLQVIEVRTDRCLCLQIDGSGWVGEGDIVLPMIVRETYPEEGLPQ